jgi:hypothetical protein
MQQALSGRCHPHAAAAHSSSSSSRVRRGAAARRVQAVAAPAAAAPHAAGMAKQAGGKQLQFMKYQGLGNDFILVR